LARWLVAGLDVLVGSLAGWLDVWLPRWLAGHLADQTSGWLAGWLDVWQARWLPGRHPPRSVVEMTQRKPHLAKANSNAQTRNLGKNPEQKRHIKVPRKSKKDTLLFSSLFHGTFSRHFFTALFHRTLAVSFFRIKSIILDLQDDHFFTVKKDREKTTFFVSKKVVVFLIDFSRSLFDDFFEISFLIIFRARRMPASAQVRSCMSLDHVGLAGWLARRLAGSLAG
jgi:hypothetical protein